MSFNNQWHLFEVAQHWPEGSVVLARIKGEALYHIYTYILINNWRPFNPCWDRKQNTYQLIEEPKKNENSKS